MAQLKEISSNKTFGGVQKVFSHHSKELSCEMNFAIFLPDENQKFPVLYYLSGLTCNELNCVQKGGFQRYAAEHGVIVVCPDTSPRNIEGLDTSAFSWDFGYGAGFYVDATNAPYKANFRMFSYVTSELIDVVNANFNGKLIADPSNDYLTVVISRSKQAIDLRSLDGRTRSHDLCLEESRLVPECVSFCADFQPNQLPVGKEGSRRLPGR